MKKPTPPTPAPQPVAPPVAASPVVEAVDPLLPLLKQYKELTAIRDQTYARVQPLEDRLTAVNAQICALQEEASQLGREIEAGWGPGWLHLKRQIRLLAQALSLPNGYLEVKPDQG